MINAALDLLAIEGGPQAIPDPFPPYRSIGEEEIEAANRVLRSGVLSGFLGAPGPGFFGGPEVQALESEAAERFGVRHVVAVNSWTSDQVVAFFRQVWTHLEACA